MKMKKYGRQSVHRKHRGRLARDKEVRELAKSLQVQLTNEQWAEVCEWIEKKIPFNGSQVFNGPHV